MDFLSIFCAVLVALGSAAIISASQTFTIVSGKVVSVGSAFIVTKEGRIPTKTVKVLIEDADRVFRIQPGATVEYAVSDDDASKVQPGYKVKLMVSLNQSKARLVSIQELPAL
jgi:hypothetical protein